MANIISDETMEYVSILAKLELSDEEREAAKRDMETMLDYIDRLNELDTSGVEPMTHVFPVHNVFREDVAGHADGAEDIPGHAHGAEDMAGHADGAEDTLANAPERRNRAFVVPMTVEK